MKKKDTKNFASRWGFILASVGSAVGMANVWGFPNKLGSNGGGAFLLIYLLFVVIFGTVGLPTEFAIGRRAGTGTLGAYKEAWGTRGKTAGKVGGILGWLPLAGSLCIAIGYAVIVTYILKALVDSLAGTLMTTDAAAWFDAFSSQPYSVIPYHIIVVGGTLLTLFFGARSIEKTNKVMMPVFFLIFVVLAVRVALLPGSAEGYKFMFNPDFSVFSDPNVGFGRVLKNAAGQMFFSLSIGLGVMITYGSYLGKQEHLQRNAFIVCGADTLIALMAGMAVMPACSAFGVEYGAGPGLLFASMQTVFSHMGSVGNLIGFLFYLLVLIAALTSSISMLELCTAYAVDKQSEKGLTPKRAKHTSEVAALVFIAGSLVALDGLGAGVAGGAAVETPATLLGLSVRGWNDCWLDLYDMVAEGILMPLGALVMTILIGWVLKPEVVQIECEQSGVKYRAAGYFKVCFKFIVPVLLAFILFCQLTDFFGLNIPGLS